MVSREQFEIVLELVDDAVAARRPMHCGGPARPLTGSPEAAFYAPTVLTGVTHEMRIMREEIFGPVLPIVVVDSEDEAVALANDTVRNPCVGVDADRSKGERIARELESGMVWINDHMFSHGACQCSWGGIKESGLGRTHSKFGLYECVNVKLRVWEPSRCATPGGPRTTRRSGGRCARPRRSSTARPRSARGAEGWDCTADEARRAARTRRRQALVRVRAVAVGAVLPCRSHAGAGLQWQGMRVSAP